MIHMDLISGTVVLTSVFLLAVALASNWISRAPWPTDGAAHQMIEHVMNRRSRTMIITLLIGYFVGIADVLVSAQLPAIAFINIVIGAGTIAVLYDVSNRRGGGEDENWRR